MSQAPSMPLFCDALMADTMHLTAEERGAYMWLLMSMWRHNGSVPDDDRDNARITSLTVPKWKRIKERLRPLLIFTDERITQKRLQKEWKYVEEFSQQQREKGIKSGEARRNKNNGLTRTTVPPRLEPNANPHTHTHIKKNTKRKIQEILEGVIDRDRALAIIEHRTQLKKPLTAHAAKLLSGKLGKWKDPNAAADKMIERGWAGFESEWMTNIIAGTNRSTGSFRKVFEPEVEIDKGTEAERDAQVERLIGKTARAMRA